jgi:Protein of unknown function (DUF1329)
MTMDEMQPKAAREPQQVIDALAELFDAVPPARTIEAEEELIETGQDPSRIAAAMQRVVETELGPTAGIARSRRGRAAEPAAGRIDRAPRRWRSIGLVAAGFVAGALVSTWWAKPTAEPGRARFPRLAPQGRRLAERRPVLRGEQGSDASTARSIGGAPPVSRGAQKPPAQPENVDAIAPRSGVPAGAAGEEAGPAEDATLEASSKSLPVLPAPEGGAGGVIAELNADTWKIAQGRMPPELLRHYRSGEWWHTIRQLPPEVRLQDPKLLEAGERNRGRFAIGKHGEIVDVATAGPAESVFGPPFPAIDPGDPHAGIKIVWNYLYQSYAAGDARATLAADTFALDGANTARHFALGVSQRFWDGQAKPHKGQNVERALSEKLAALLRSPSDLAGTALLTRRMRDAERRDDTYLYLPSLRRVRRLSSVERSEALFKQDISPDDGAFFDGNPVAFDWRLVGASEALAFVDRRAAIDGVHDFEKRPDGTFARFDSRQPRFAYQLDSPEGSAIRPLDSEVVLVNRPVWIIECVSPDAFYAFGRLVLWFDAETWQGVFAVKYDRNGQPWKLYLPVLERFFEIDGAWRSYAASAFTLMEDLLLEHATAVYPVPDEPITTVNDFPDDLFTISTMITGFGG